MDQSVIIANDIQLLHKYGLSQEDVAHSVKVAEIAMTLAGEMSRVAQAVLDNDLVLHGALLHDLGKGREPGLAHGEAGYQLAQELNLPPKLAAMVDKHVLAGLTPEEAHGMGLPPRDRTLKTMEERLVVYADKLADLLEETDYAANLNDARQRFAEILMADLDLSKGSEAARDRYIQAGKDVEMVILRKA